MHNPYFLEMRLLPAMVIFPYSAHKICFLDINFFESDYYWPHDNIKIFFWRSLSFNIDFDEFSQPLFKEKN